MSWFLNNYQTLWNKKSSTENYNILVIFKISWNPLKHFRKTDNLKIAWKQIFYQENILFKDSWYIERLGIKNSTITKLTDNKVNMYCGTRYFRGHHIFANCQFWTFCIFFFRVLALIPLLSFVIVLLACILLSQFFLTQNSR